MGTFDVTVKHFVRVDARAGPAKPPLLGPDKRFRPKDNRGALREYVSLAR